MFYNNLKTYHDNGKTKFLICGFEYNKNIKYYINKMATVFEKLYVQKQG